MSTLPCLLRGVRPLAAVFPSENSEGREPLLLSHLFGRLELLLLKSPSDAWHEQVWALLLTGSRAPWLKCPLTQGPSQNPAGGSASWVCPHGAGGVSHTEGLSFKKPPMEHEGL